MNAQQLIADLLGAGLTQVSIGERTGMAQSCVSRLLNGQRERISYEVGERLLALHAKHSKRKRRK